METIFKILLFAHIAAGAVALVAGPVALLVKKGGPTHVRAGLVFYHAMLVAAGASLVLAVMHPNPFLFAVGIFSGYMNLTGRRYLTQKQRGRANQAGDFEKILAGLMLVGCLYLVGFGGYLLLRQNWFGTVFVFFGFISGQMLRDDFKVIAGREVPKNFWLRQHIVRMIGTCIASFTAFLVVNLAEKLGFVTWLLPSVVFAPLISYWLRRNQA